MDSGIVIKTYSGFCYVKTEKGQLFECKLRGKFKKTGNKAIPGDRVQFEVLDEKSGIIEKIDPRTNLLIRPMVANVQQVLITFAAQKPNLSYKLLDQFLIMAEATELNIVICLNKLDLVEETVAKEMLDIYEKIGYPIVYCSAKTGYGISEFKKILQNKISVFAGASGVGKSALLNAIQPGLRLQTGEISKKIKRGTHTTRHVELLQLEIGGMVADTPGFSYFEMEFLTSEELPYLFPEMVAGIGRCRYQNCTHDHEPGCSIKQLLADGQIAPSRYETYLGCLHQIQERERERSY